MSMLFLLLTSNFTQNSIAGLENFMSRAGTADYGKGGPIQTSGHGRDEPRAVRQGEPPGAVSLLRLVRDVHERAHHLYPARQHAQVSGQVSEQTSRKPWQDKAGLISCPRCRLHLKKQGRRLIGFSF